MKTRYRTWHLPVLSFYSKHLYRDLSARWKGTNLGYLCLLLAICLVPVARNISHLAGEKIDQYADVFLMQVPPMELGNGTLIVDAPQPYSIIKGDHTVLLIDTTGRIQAPEEVDALALLTKTQLIVRRSNGPSKVYNLADFGSRSLNREIVAEIISHTKRRAMPVVYTAAYFAGLMLCLSITLLFGAVARLLASKQQRSLDYHGGLRLTTAALTPALIAVGVMEAVNLSIPPLVYLALALAYLYGSVGYARLLRADQLGGEAAVG